MSEGSGVSILQSTKNDILLVGLREKREKGKNISPKFEAAPSTDMPLKLVNKASAFFQDYCQDADNT